MEIRPENEYEKLLRLSNEYTDEKAVPASLSRPCGGYSLRYECACDLYQTPCFRAVPNVSELESGSASSHRRRDRKFSHLP